MRTMNTVPMIMQNVFKALFYVGFFVRSGRLVESSKTTRPAFLKTGVYAYSSVAHHVNKTGRQMVAVQITNATSHFRVAVAGNSISPVRIQPRRLGKCSSL